MQTNSKWSEELEILRSIIDKFPLEKEIKWGSEVFSYKGRNVISYGGFKNHFALWFYNGVFLSDPYKCLVNASEGKTKSLRQWRFTSKTEIDEEKIGRYIREAIEVEEKGLKIAPEKFVPIAIPEILERELKDESLQVAFKNLSPGKQKEYILYINEAKQEATKNNRINKIKPMILEGLGLNDKYKK